MQGREVGCARWLFPDNFVHFDHFDLYSIIYQIIINTVLYYDHEGERLRAQKEMKGQKGNYVNLCIYVFIHIQGIGLCTLSFHGL